MAGKPLRRFRTGRGACSGWRQRRKLTATVPLVQVASGYRMPMPRSFPEPLKRLIGACWAQDAAERPCAASVHAQLALMQETGALQTMDGRRNSFSCFG